MSNIFIPIEYSNVSEVVPKGDDILYSTLCEMYKLQVGGSHKKWESQVLLTQSGCAFNGPKKRKKTELLFLKWTGLRKIRTTLSKNLALRYGRGGYGEIRLNVMRDPEYESEEDFLKRKNNFPNFCRELWSKQKQEEET